MSGFPKYTYPPPVPLKNRKWPDNTIKTAPAWCSVDLRDGNQALPIPMNPDKKVEYFKMLAGIGFKEIEVSFPSASKDDFDFVRRLVEKNLIPDDVTISVLTQARRHLIEKTVESLKDVRRAVLHMYVPTSDLHGRFVFNRSREEVKKMILEGASVTIESLEKAGLRKNVAFEFSPEEFTDSDVDFVIDVCKDLKKLWGPCKKGDFILNLPATVERRPPYQYADMIEYFINNYPYADQTVISIHAHNDQGCAVAASEMAILAGAERVEGTIFGHGERTGNLDICTLALNLLSRGVDPKLDFSNLPKIVETVEKASGIQVHPRHPYAGQLVFTAFSGSHQDAIRKGMTAIKKAAERFKQGWKVPYLHVDPADLGRTYENLIRINSQSGKGGMAYVLEREFGICLPKNMHPELGTAVQALADKKGEEINAEELLGVFRKTFMEANGPYALTKFTRVNEDSDSDMVGVRLSVKINGEPFEIEGRGNGPISASAHAMQESGKFEPFKVEDFSEQSLGSDADATAMAFVGVRKLSDSTLTYGVGEHSNIDMAALHAVFAALNKAVL